MPEATLPEGATEPGTHLDDNAAVSALRSIRERDTKPVAAKPAPAPEAETPEAPAEEPAQQTEGEQPTDAPAEPTVAVDVSAIAKALGIPETDLVMDEDGTVSLKTMIDGKDGMVKPADLRKSYQLDSSFTHKSMLLAEERRAFDTERQAVVTDLTQQKQALNVATKMAQQLLHAEFAEINWDQLKAANFQQYLQLKDQFETKQRMLQSLHATLNKGEQDKLQRETQETDAWRRQQAAEIVNHFPEWKDAKVAESALKAIFDTAKSDYGIKQEELDQLYDSRYVRILADAKAFRDLKAKNPGVMQRVNKAPPLAKPGTTQKPNQTKLTDAKQRFGHTHSTADAVAILREMRGAK